MKADRDFRLVHGRGRKFVTPYFFARALQRMSRVEGGQEPRGARFGFSASERVGSAVVRNRAKRRLREATRTYLSQTARGGGEIVGCKDSIAGWDFVISAREAAATAPFSDLVTEIERAIRNLSSANKPTQRQPRRHSLQNGRDGVNT
ncbi:MAG: ribonuclease P protein component [Armatimonadetes bacterium]|nr:ribonuclease P protein component [Armatimonadota bacterium]